jgi:hypothetical protein
MRLYTWRIHLCVYRNSEVFGLGDELAGVLGHGIGHADMRHSTRQMTTMYGVQTLEQILLGNHAHGANYLSYCRIEVLQGARNRG